jgi:hypothetical protein
MIMLFLSYNICGEAVDKAVNIVVWQCGDETGAETAGLPPITR